MKIEFNLISEDDFTLGISMAKGADEYGEFNIFTIGLFFVSIDFYSYNN